MYRNNKYKNTRNSNRNRVYLNKPTTTPDKDKEDDKPSQPNKPNQSGGTQNNEQNSNKNDITKAPGNLPQTGEKNRYIYSNSNSIVNCNIFIFQIL